MLTRLIKSITCGSKTKQIGSKYLLEYIFEVNSLFIQPRNI